ncbi:MAG: biotin-dependent carboxyltransferase family protein [Veillonellales bacterium]
MQINVLRPGLLTTLQDLGRYGFQKYGIIVSGGMDLYSLRIANVLVGNDEAEAALEITLMGPSLMLEKGTLFAITGGDLSPKIDGIPVPTWRPVFLRQDSELQFGPCTAGCRSYLAVAGGYGFSPVMGSKSTYLRAAIGGFHGRGLEKGDILPLGNPGEKSRLLICQLENKMTKQPFSTTPWQAKASYITKQDRIRQVRVTRGRHFDHFTEESQSRFFQEAFEITKNSDRMGYRLSGPTMKLKAPLEMVSEGIVLGTVQVPPDGNPIVLVADRHSVGGYPKIAQVIMADIPVLAQIKPGEKIQLQEVSLEEAENIYLENEKRIQTIKTAIHLQIRG